MTENTSVLEDQFLTREQDHVISEVIAWQKEGGKQTVTVGGYAGTGKTTVIKKVREKFKEMSLSTAVVAFTGKAVAVMRRKGLEHSQTLHSLCYHVKGKDKARQPIFEKVPNIFVDLVIVDESSQINTEMDKDLRSFGKSILYVGDHGQLEPIGDNPNLMASPDYTLEEIHRNAGGIAEFCAKLRKASPVGYYEGEDLFASRREEQVSVGGKQLFLDTCLDSDVCICGFNRTRHATNKYFRDSFGYSGKLPMVGEKLICLQNNRYLNLYNGLLVTVTAVGEEKSKERVILLDIEDDLGNKWEGIPAAIEQFGKDKAKGQYDYKRAFFDFGYCLTCHKAQGSEWGKVAVAVEVGKSWSPNRWWYTAGSRAINHLSFCRIQNG